MPRPDLGFTPRELRTLRALRTPRGVQRALDAMPCHARFDRAHPGWMTGEDEMWWIPQPLVGLPHTPLLTKVVIRSLSRVDRRSLQAGLVGYCPH